jgi:hypothetical protein
VSTATPIDTIFTHFVSTATPIDTILTRFVSTATRFVEMSIFCREAHCG